MTIKLVVFDFDGTLADVPAPSSWELIDKTLGCEEEDKILNEAYFSGKINYATWSSDTIELYKKHGLNKVKFDEIMQKYVRPMPGAKETFDSLRKRGKKIAIVSGSILNIYEFLSSSYGVRADYVSFATEIFFDHAGNIAGSDCNNYDYEGKVKAIEKICGQAGIPMKDCAMVGDSPNDIFAFRKVGLPVAFNSRHPEVEKEAKFVIKGKDLREVLPLV